MKILMVDPDATADDELAAALREYGHDVEATEDGAAGDVPDEFRPDVVVARLGDDASATLAALARARGRRGWGAAPLLFTGTNEVAIASARRMFPDASFARADLVVTAIESLHAGE